MSILREGLTNAGLLWLRVLTGAGMAYHGYGKVFGGYMDKVIEGVAAMGFPAPAFFAWAASLSEFAGGILLVLGLFTRHAASFILITMGVAAFIKHGPDTFQVKELALAYFVAAGAVLLLGPGKISIDCSIKACSK